MTSSVQRDMNRSRVWRLAGPMILSNVTVPLTGVVDTAVMGHMPDARYLSAVAAGSMVFTILFFLFNFLRMGVTGFAAQAIGRSAIGLPAIGRSGGTELRAVLARGALLSVTFGSLILFLQGGLISLGLMVMNPGASVVPLARDYMEIRVWCAPFTLSSMVVLGGLIGMERADLAMMQQISINVLNACLNILFVFGFDWGVEGVAWATVCAEVMGVALGVFLLRRGLPIYSGRFVLSDLWDRQAMVQMMSMNRDIFLRTFALEMALLAFMALGARQGEVTFAANAVLMNFLMVAAFGLDAFAFSAETLVGRSVGARDVFMLRRAVRLSFEPTMTIAVLLTVVYFAFGDVIVSVMTSIPTVQAEADVYLFWAAILPVTSAAAFLLDGVFFGATCGPQMRGAMVKASAVFFLSLLVFVPVMGNHGLWLSLNVMNVARAVFLWRRYDRVIEKCTD